MCKRTLTNVQCRTCSTPYSTNDIQRTIPDLAMTPQQVKALADRGVPVSGQNMAAIYEPDTAGWKIDPIFERGADVCQLWERERIARKNVLNARKREIQMLR